MLLLLSFALADVVGPDPTDCPKGSHGTSSHAGEWCTPDETCDDESSCAVGTCAEVGLCISSEEVSCGGMQSDTGEPCTFVKEEVHGTCREQSDCGEGDCVRADRCVEGALPCGCSTSSGGWLSALAGLLVLVLARLR